MQRKAQGKNRDCIVSDFEGVIIEESLANKQVLDQVEIISQKVEHVTDKHKTPWVDRWTLDTVSLPAEKANTIAELLSHSIDISHPTTWYADSKNDTHHYIIYPNKIFYIDRKNIGEYQKATDYGVSLGIPDYQVDFEPNTTVWDR